MRTSMFIGYFALIAVIIMGVGMISAEDVYRFDGRTFHQRIFGFKLDLPPNWQVIDNGAVSANGEYVIILGPELPSEPKLFLRFVPVKGLTLLEFINETIIGDEFFSNIQLDVSSIGNVDCYVARQCMSSDASGEFPDLTNIFARIGDHYLNAMVYSYDKTERDKVLDILETIQANEKLRELSFLLVRNHSQYGIPIITESNSEMYLFDTDPEIQADVESADGSETVIIDDLSYPARFPAGEHRDTNGYRTQFYGEGRYHVDNRGKKIDVYIPDINVVAKDFKLGVDIRFEGGHPLKGNGVIFKGCQKGFYLFELSPDGYCALYRFTGLFEPVLEKTFVKRALSFDDNRLEVEMKNNDVTLRLNGWEILSFDIQDKFDPGFVGFYVCAGAWVSFDNYLLEIYS